MHILLTGGGTAGHVLPNLAIADATRARTDAVHFTYLGSRSGMERQLVKEHGMNYSWVATGKLRRYWSLRNAVDALLVPIGVLQAWMKLGRIKPDLIFSKGGFVGFPAVVAGRLRGIPVLIHESDAIPGLTTQLCAPFATKILLGYREAAQPLKRWKKKIKVVGNPVRPGVVKGDRTRARALTGFSGRRPVLLVMGGSTGAQELNQLVAKHKTQLTKRYDVVHLLGKGRHRPKKEAHYASFGLLGEELLDVYALASLALSRAGAGALAELEALQLPTLLYPLGHHQSRGDQWANAQAAQSRSPFLRINSGQPLLQQLAALPKRKKKHQDSAALGKIVSLLLSKQFRKQG